MIKQWAVPFQAVLGELAHAGSQHLHMPISVVSSLSGRFRPLVD